MDQSPARALVWAIVALSLAISASVGAFFAARLSPSGEKPAADDWQPPSRVELSLEDVVVSGVEDGKGESHLTAKRIQIRQRIGASGLLLYRDVKEIFASGVDLSATIDSDQRALLSEVVATTRRFLPLDVRQAALREGPDGATSTARVLFRDLSIHLKGMNEARLSIRASGGRLNSGSHTLVLDGAVIALPHGTLRAPRAVFSDERNGFLAPVGYVSAGVRVAEHEFLVADEAGRFHTSPGVPAFDYADPIEEKERLVLAHLLERAPPALKPMLALMAGGLVANARSQ